VDKSDDLDFILPPIFKHNKEITALFTMSDELLAKSIYHINTHNLSIPKDIAVMSLSDGVYPYLNHPQISHVKDSGTKMGRNAGKLLLEYIAQTADISKARIRVSTKLVELGSV
jgi:DNA-binding LacI/PurR family transcriptional regulator